MRFLVGEVKLLLISITKSRVCIYICGGPMHEYEFFLSHKADK